MWRRWSANSAGNTHGGDHDGYEPSWAAAG